jgi:hypothetical protein
MANVFESPYWKLKKRMGKDKNDDSRTEPQKCRFRIEYKATVKFDK